MSLEELRAEAEIIEAEQEENDNREFRKVILHELATEIYATADKSGWHGDETFGDKVALMHSELSEALDEFRNGRKFDEIYYTYKQNGIQVESASSMRREDDGTLTPNKVEGIASELADTIIRILDDSVRFGIPTIDALFQKMEYNKTRPFRHGGKAI